MLRFCLYLPFFTLWTLTIILVVLPCSLFGTGYLNGLVRIWARVSLWMAGVSTEVEGVEDLPEGRPVIFMPNHQSNFDIPALYAAVPSRLRWIAKQELFRIPLFGLAMRRMECVPIDRSDRRKAIQSMAEAARRIATGGSVVIFPEGTRSFDGKLLPFKKGAFILALQSGVPIVPVAIRGSREVMPKKRLRIRPGTITVTLLPPVETAGRPATDRDTLMEQVRRPIAAALGQSGEPSKPAQDTAGS